MSEPTSPRDELVTLLSEHETQPGFGRCSCGVIYGNAPAAQHTHLADVLLAGGWSKGPSIDVRATGGRLDTFVDPYEARAEAERAEWLRDRDE